MPLPPILAVRLAKRGLIAPRSNKTTAKDQKKNHKGSSGCPNKYNIHHECNYWCDTHWKGILQPDQKYVRKMQRLLMKYPLPHNWMEVFDKGIGRYYYWDMETDMVSWLPPKHPKAVRTKSASKLREKLLSEVNEIEEERVVARKEDDRRRHSKYTHDRKDKDSKEKDDRRHRHEDKERYRKRSRKDDLDPMDPAAYSDVPQGTWSDGLENNKTKADSTASGALYQQRPYPAPGEVLALNKNKLKKTVNFGNISYVD